MTSDAPIPPYDTAAAMENDIAELRKALSDAMPFVAIHVARWAEDNGGKMHDTHRELLDRIGRLIGNENLSQRLERV